MGFDSPKEGAQKDFERNGQEGTGLWESAMLVVWTPLEGRILLRKRNDVGSIPGGNTQMVWESQTIHFWNSNLWVPSGGRAFKKKTYNFFLKKSAFLDFSNQENWSVQGVSPL